MKMYLVRRYADELPEGEYGISDNYYVVGLFTDEAIAKSIMEREKAQADDETEIDIISIEVNKIYDENEQIFLGGGFYIE